MEQTQDKPITEEFNEGWEEGRHAADVEVMQLRAEVERLQEQVRNRDYALNRLGELKDAKIEDAAAFLDVLAERLSPRELETGTQGMFDRMAADCRAMAKKLRGET